MEKAKKKYIPCSGLAFLGDEDMEMLHAYALEGWIFRDFRFLGYVLYKEEPQDLIFSFDMNSVKKEEQEEYLAVFAQCGWREIPCQTDSIWFFVAPQGTVPVYSDHETKNSQFEKVATSAKWILLIAAAITLLCFLFMRRYTFLLVPFGIGIGVCGATLMLSLSAYMRKHQIMLCTMPFKTARILCLLCLAILLSTLVLPEVTIITFSWIVTVLRFLAWILLPVSVIEMLWQYPLY